MKRLFYFLTTLSMFWTACSSQSSSSKSFTEKKIIVPSKGTVTIKEVDLSVTNNGCGRKWMSEGNSPSYERPYCELVIKHKDSTFHAGMNFDNIYSGDIEITIDRMNPWGNEEDSVPAGGCRLIVRRTPAYAMLEKYGWTAEKVLGHTKIDFPETLTGLPWTHYASCTKATGFDLDSIAGQSFDLVKIQLKEKGKRSSTNLWAHIVIDDGKAITGWISSQVLAPGLAPLNLEKDKLSNW